ncbi:hypothetical protein C0993_009015 [Termitomyces sp. T159_Od127]|nr:hypothetical protein C0993_009015 [Termitomyces sp. T159_Od127]
MPDSQAYLPPRPVVPILPAPAAQPAANQPVIPPAPPREREREQPKKRKPTRKKTPTTIISFELPATGEHARRPSQSSAGPSSERAAASSPTRPSPSAANPLPKVPVDIFTTTPYKHLAPTLAASPTPQRKPTFGLGRKKPLQQTNPDQPPPPSATTSEPPPPPPPPSAQRAAPPRPRSPPPPIYFNQNTPYAGFLNHSPHSVSYERTTYPTAAHLIEASKFLPETPANAGVASAIRAAPDLADVYRLAGAHRAAQNEVAQDGEAYMHTMQRVMYLKFTQHAELAEMLRATGEARLVYDDPSDSFWGGGVDGEGKNELGCMLESVRAMLRERAGG